MFAIKWFQWPRIVAKRFSILYTTLSFFFPPFQYTYTHTHKPHFSLNNYSTLISYLLFLLLPVISNYSLVAFCFAVIIFILSFIHSLLWYHTLTWTHWSAYLYLQFLLLLSSLLAWLITKCEAGREIWRLMSNFYRSQVLCAPTRKRREEGRKGGKFGEIGKRIFCFLVQSFNRGGSGGGGGMQIISLSVSVSFRFNTFIFSVLSLALSCLLFLSDTLPYQDWACLAKLVSKVGVDR